MCRALMRFWLVHGHFETGRDACTTALVRPQADRGTAVRAATVHAAATMSQMLGSYGEARALNAKALELQKQDAKVPTATGRFRCGAYIFSTRAQPALASRSCPSKQRAGGLMRTCWVGLE